MPVKNLISKSGFFFFFYVKIYIFLIDETFSQQATTLSTSFGNLNNVDQTIVITESKDIGACTCDLTPKSCDYLCCCDSDCPSNYVTTWTKNSKNICKDKQLNENAYLTQCFNDNILYSYNRKRGLWDYRDPVSNLFCVTMDNSSIMDKFYKGIPSVSSTLIDSLFNQYVDLQVKKNLYYNFTSMYYGLDSNATRYSAGDHLKAINGSSSYITDGKLVLYQANSYGLCAKSSHVRYMIPNPRTTCGMKFTTFFNCASKQWDEILTSNITLLKANFPILGSVNITLRNIYLKDATTGLIQTTSNPGKTQLVLKINDDCTCNNILDELKLIFIASYYDMTLTAVYADIVLATNVKRKCSSRTVYTQAYSSVFLTSINEDFIRSGSPGYLYDKRLLIGFNDNGNIFKVPQDGMYVIGRNIDGSCYDVKENPLYSPLSNFDNPIMFGRDAIYSCQKSFTLEKFAAFCQSQDWKNYMIFNFIKRIQYVGILGSANYNYLQDWKEVIMDYNFSNSQYTQENSTCFFPSTILFDVLVSKSGTSTNPQNYVISARLSSINESVKYSSNGGQQIIRLKFITSFLSPESSPYNLARDTPSILPRLPPDIASPLAVN